MEISYTVDKSASVKSKKQKQKISYWSISHCLIEQLKIVSYKWTSASHRSGGLL